MKDEVYDVVDKRDRVIGKATWTECHTKGLRHRSACVLIFRDRKKRDILLQKRSRKMKQDPGKWQHSAGGHVLSGDTPREAAMKEMKEELFSGISMPKIKLKKIVKFENDNLRNNHEISTIFEAIYPGPFSGKSEEVEGDPIWVNFDFVKKDIIRRPSKYTKSFRNVMRAYCRSTRI
jgi:isopentenyldiphosphate isomerase